MKFYETHFEDYINTSEKQNLHPNAIALLIISGERIWRRPLLRWWMRSQHVKSPKSAKELINEGWEPGPKLGKQLQKLRNEKLDDHKNLY